MAGGLLNLVAEGANNTIIQGGNEQKTLFKATYKKINEYDKRPTSTGAKVHR